MSAINGSGQTLGALNPVVPAYQVRNAMHEIRASTRPLARTIVDVVADINAEYHAAERDHANAVRHAIRCGELLLEAKDRLLQERGHGRWLEWLAENFRGSQRSARNYMVFARLGPEQRQRVAVSSLRQALKSVADTKTQLAVDVMMPSMPLEERHPKPSKELSETELTTRRRKAQARRRDRALAALANWFDGLDDADLDDLMRTIEAAIWDARGRKSVAREEPRQ